MSFDPTSAPALVVLRRGDRVLVVMHEDPDPDDAQAYMQTLHRAFPGVSFIILGAAAGVLVQPGDKSPEDTEET